MIAAFTAANERSIRNWLNGRDGPSEELFVALRCHSDVMLKAVVLFYVPDRTPRRESHPPTQAEAYAGVCRRFGWISFDALTSGEVCTNWIGRLTARCRMQSWILTAGCYPAIRQRSG